MLCSGGRVFDSMMYFNTKAPLEVFPRGKELIFFHLELIFEIDGYHAKYIWINLRLNLFVFYGHNKIIIVVYHRFL